VSLLTTNLTNPHRKSKPSIFRHGFTLTETPKEGSPSIYSTNLYQWAKNPILEINRFAPSVTAGGRQTPRPTASDGPSDSTELPAGVCTGRLPPA
jgi:hypothetical protein